MNLQPAPRQPHLLPSYRYVELAELIRRSIRNGTYKPGAVLPNHHDIARSYQVSLSTVKLALDLLQVEGLITKTRGKGTFVRLEPSRWILVVHNDRKAESRIRKHLQVASVGVVGVKQGNEALGVVQQRNIWMVMIQLTLRNLDALELASRLRESGKDVPIVYLVSPKAHDAELSLVRKAITQGPATFMSDRPSKRDLDETAAQYAHIL